MAVQCVVEHGLGLCSWLHKKTIDGSSAYIYGFIQMLTGIVQEIRDVNLPDTQILMDMDKRNLATVTTSLAGRG